MVEIRVPAQLLIPEEMVRINFCLRAWFGEEIYNILYTQ